jgi:hypothetical protein
MMPVARAEKSRTGINKLSSQLSMYLRPVTFIGDVKHVDDSRKKLTIGVAYINKNGFSADRHRKVKEKTYDIREFVTCNSLLKGLNEKLMKNASKF